MAKDLDFSPALRQDRQVANPVSAPSFFLYGEAPREVDRHFLHVEALDDRSRPSEWSIQAHSHAGLHHIFLLSAGCGTMVVDGRKFTFMAPCILLIPARMIHGFAFAPNSRGRVMTIAETFFAELVLRQTVFAGVFASAAVVDIADDAALVDLALGEIQRELTWPTAVRETSIEGALLVSVAAIARMRAASIPTSALVSRGSVDLVARFRDAAEQNWRKRLPIASYAKLLGASTSRLRAACIEVTGRSPIAALQARTMLEAQRALIYSSLSVADIGYAIGFDDPAYFSRAFRCLVGCSPKEFRAGTSAAKQSGSFAEKRTKKCLV